ncbi:hypothetical protein HII36_39375, partial [Nonomuraea sp. NN258]|nr:hypothetical protein [Nonomuraea antri]
MRTSAPARAGRAGRGVRLTGVARRTLLTAALVAALAAVLGVIFLSGRPSLGWYGAAWALFAAALWALRGVPERWARPLVLAGGAAAIATGLLGPPGTSTDFYRYVWDGRVQAAGLSPYDRPPADPALAPLRDPWLFPTSCPDGRFYPLPGGGCTRINRPTVHTIYPPLAEAYFLLVARVSPDGSRHRPLQTAGALLAAATSLVLLLRRGPGRAACWAWCPAVPMEAVNNAHVDMLAVAAVALAFAARIRHRGLQETAQETLRPPVEPATPGGVPGGA